MRLACLLRTVVRLFCVIPGTREMLNGTLTAAILHDDEEVVVPDNEKAIFYAAAELAVRYFLCSQKSVQTHKS